MSEVMKNCNLDLKSHFDDHQRPIDALQEEVDCLSDQLIQRSNTCIEAYNHADQIRSLLQQKQHELECEVEFESKILKHQYDL